MKKKKKRRQDKYTAMSKLIGIFIALLVLVIVLFSMYEIHRTNDVSPLQYLIVGVFAICASYIGFYINMAKAEHIEDRKNQIRRELELIRKDGITPEEEIQIEHYKEELENLESSLEELSEEEDIKYE